MRRALLLGLMLLASCRSAEPSYYTLAPLPGLGLGGGPALIELRRPGVAGYLDRSEIVRSNSPYQLKLDSAERWAEPFSDMVARVLAEDLHNRLPGTTVFTSTGAITADTGARVEIDLQRFDADGSGQVQLLAQVAVTRGVARDTATAQTVRLAVPAPGPSTRDYVQAMSEALGQMADRIASQLRR